MSQVSPPIKSFSFFETNVTWGEVTPTWTEGLHLKRCNKNKSCMWQPIKRLSQSLEENCLFIHNSCTIGDFIDELFLIRNLLSFLPFQSNSINSAKSRLDKKNSWIVLINRSNHFNFLSDILKHNYANILI